MIFADGFDQACSSAGADFGSSQKRPRPRTAIDGDADRHRVPGAVLKP
jgi:hypothetical protein